MAKKISELDPAGTLTGPELVVLVQDGITVRSTLTDLLAYISSGGSSKQLRGLTFTSETGSTADSDPGAGLFKWNNATQASSTALYFDAATIDAVATTTFFASLGSSGFIYLQQEDDETKWQLWKWTAAPTSATGYYKFTSLTLQGSSGSIADNKTVLTTFTPLGSAATGDVTGPGSSTDNTLARFDSTTGKVIQGSGIEVTDNDEMSGYRANINFQTGTTYTLQASDRGKIIDLSNASAITVTCPATLAQGFNCTLVQSGAGQVTLSATTLRHRQSHTKLAGQWAVGFLEVRTNSGGSAAEYVFGGDTTT